MSRRRSLSGSLLVALLMVLLLPLLPATAADPAEAETATPLTVHLARLTPSVIPERGRLVMAGTVTNDSEETWNAVNVHPFISLTPITSRDALAAASATDEATEVGTRLYAQDQFAAIGDLAPGRTASFRISLKVKNLPISLTAEGVYWIGVHALGQNAQGGARETLGRARTFIPLVRGTKQTSVSIVVPVRERVRRDSDGRVLGVTQWASDLAPDGRLGRLAGFLTSAGSHQATLLIDPAVLDAVADLSSENPPLSFGNGEEEKPSDEPTTPVSRSIDRFDPVQQANAASWYSRVTAAARAHTVLGLGYADPDATSLARRRPAMLETAAKLSTQTFGALDIPAVPAIAPPDGWLDDDLLGRIPSESMLLVSDHAAPRTRTHWRTSSSQDLVFTDEQAGTGGPGPTESTEALALRQRIVSDAALRLGERSSGPMVVQLPSDWNPGAGWPLADFFNGLDQPWLDLVSLNPASGATTPTFDAALGYPAAEHRLEIPGQNLTTTRSLLDTTTLLSSTLLSKNTIAHDLAGIAFDAVSYHARGDELAARSQVYSTNAAVQQRLGSIEVIGTDFVTLSGGSGTLAVTLVNGLDQPVVIGVKARTSTGDVQIEEPEPLKMAPGERAVLRLKAKASGISVSEVVLSAVSTEGTPLGTPLTFSLRTSQVGMLIWAVLGAAALLLVVMIARRIRKGIREHRWRRA